MHKSNNNRVASGCGRFSRLREATSFSTLITNTQGKGRRASEASMLLCGMPLQGDSLWEE